MGGMGIALDLVLIGLLAVTLLHAVRLQRSLAALRQDRGAFDDVIRGFDEGARQAEASLVRLKQAADQVQGQLQMAGALKDDLAFLSDRGERLADQLETLVRDHRNLAAAPPRPEPPAPVRSQAERNLLLALQARR